MRQENGDFIIVAGHRRVRAALALDLPEILVLLRGPDDGADSVRAVSENVVRCPLSAVDQWCSIEALSSDHWNDDAIGTALALPVRTIKKLRLLAHIHPAMLDHIAGGDMPKEEHLRTIAAASAEEQASVWKTHKPKRGQPSVTWWQIASALEKRRFYFKEVKFGPDEQQAFGIVCGRGPLCSRRRRHKIYDEYRRLPRRPSRMARTPICQRTASSFQPTTMAIRNFRRKRNASGVRKRKGTRSAAALIQEAARSRRSSSAFRSRLRRTESKLPLSPTMTLPSSQPNTGPTLPKRAWRSSATFAPMRSPKPLAKTPSTTSP